MNDKVLQKLITSLYQVEKGEGRVIRWKGRLCVPSNEELIKEWSFARSTSLKLHHSSRDDNNVSRDEKDVFVTKYEERIW